MRYLMFVVIVSALLNLVHIDSAQALPSDMQARSEYLLAEKLYKNGDYAGAILRGNKVIEILGGTNTRVESILANSYYNTNQLMMAYSHVEKYFETNPHVSSPNYANMVDLSSKIIEHIDYIETNTNMMFSKAPGKCKTIKVYNGSDNSFGNATICMDNIMVSKYEVTVEQFRKFVSETGYIPSAQKYGGCGVVLNTPTEKLFWDPVISKGSNWNNPGFDQAESHPVVCVSWDDADQFTKWLSIKGGKKFRLPTSFEQRLFSSDFKNEINVCHYENILSGTLSGNVNWCDDGIVHTAPVGSLLMSDNKLFDTGGNVFEWGYDWDAQLMPGNTYRNENAATTGTKRHFQGASWSSRFNGGAFVPSTTRNDLGFRVVFSE